MRRLALGLLAFALGASLVAADIDMDVEIKEKLQHFSEYRFPSVRHEANWIKAREYIETEFAYYGLRVQKQIFNTTVSTIDGEKTVEGVNIIGVAGATSNKPNAIVVVGANYDSNTRENPGPLFNNGAGIAALLETARLFMHNVKWSGHFKQNFTTIFVAFDLNTKEHDSGPGVPGGWHFVNEWLWNYLNKTDTNFGGAFVVDSIMNINQEPNSQDTSEIFRSMFPETFNSMAKNGNKGNFIGVVAPSDEKSKNLKDQFVGNYRKDRRKRPFRLEDMTLPSAINHNQIISELTTQETIHFWAFNPNGTSRPLPALLITDTEKLRAMPPNPCSGKVCPPKAWLTDEREEFLVATVKGLTNTLLRRQATRLPAQPDNSSKATLPSLFTVVVLLLLGRFYQ
ncbi:uncharacterized protein LOC122259390 [Penaeus japonicus]|uniref:uncharacterized protein LOC122259390 n=1 Tax=Penaeus japonicus TaxID=27405 RepID=UPI001C70CF88|nr:uncharacterized protein LOC122259390 [Penaeus japonicus]